MKPALNYNGNMGNKPELLDLVELCNTNSNLDTMTGMLAGWSDSMKYIAIVTLDKQLESGELAICIPVVCLKERAI